MFTGQEIRNKRKILGLSVDKLAEILNVKKDSIYKWEKGTKPNNAEEYLRVENWLSGKLENVPHENTASEPKPYFKTRQDLKNGGKKKQIPFYDAPAAAGVTETEMTAIHAPAGTIDIGDLLHDSEAAIRIYGNSMVPNYPPGCVVGLAKISNTFIEPGEVYVIETADRRLLKRLFYKDDNTDGPFITCYSDNIMKFEGGARHGKLAYPPFDLPKKEIKNLFVVTGVIKRNSNSIIINR